MAHKRKDTLANCGSWNAHLRPFGKRIVAKAERKAAEAYIAEAEYDMQATKLPPGRCRKKPKKFKIEYTMHDRHSISRFLVNMMGKTRVDKYKTLRGAEDALSCWYKKTDDIFGPKNYTAELILS